MRRPGALAALFVALCVTFAAQPAAAAEPAAVPATFSCAECGMKARGENRFTARLVAGGATSYFCDIGDLVAYLGRTGPKEFTASVRDFPSGEWVDAAAAAFAIDKKAYASPMGWGVAAFRDRAAAPPAASLDFEALRKALQ